MASPLPPDPYKILGVAKDAPLAAIRSAHRKLVLTCHPDKFPDESIKAKKADEFHQVQQSYEILSDETRRQRYDERVKLAELRAELMSDKRGPTRMASDFGPRAAATSAYDPRSHVIYEERAPRRTHEDDYASSRFERNFDDYPEYASSRRSSVRLQEEERRRARQRDHYEEEERRASREHASKLWSSQRKTRDKDRRRDYDTKYQARVEPDSESDSDSTYYSRRGSEPKSKYEESRRRDREPTSRKGGKYYDSDSTDDLENKALHQAHIHIHKIGGTRKSDSERRPSTVKRSYSTAKDRSPPPPPPPPPPGPPLDGARRSSGRTRGVRETSRTRSSPRDRRPPEIIESANRASYDSPSRRPSMPTASSEPHSIQIPHHSPKNGVPHRAATMEVRGEPRIPGIQRAATFNGTSRHGDPVPIRPSKLKTHTEVPDSEYSSPGNSDVPLNRSPKYTSTKYQYIDDDDETENGKPVLLDIKPNDGYFRSQHARHDRHEREISPRDRHGPERSGISRASTSRVTPTRSSTFAPETISPRQPLQRSDSVRVPPSPSVASHHRAPLYREVSYSPRIDRSDIQYSPRSPVSHRDYPDSRDRPSLGGREGSFAPRVASKVF